MRATFVVHRYYGMTLQEISRELHISFPMAKKYLVKPLRQAHRCMAAYLDVAANWKRTESLGIRIRFPKELLIEEALNDSDNILPHPATLDGCPAMSRSRIPSRFLSPPTWGLIAASIAIFLIGAVVLTSWLHRDPTYSTGIDEERAIKLSDGSIVEMNACSRIRMHYTTTEREIALVRGQALFVDT